MNATEVPNIAFLGFSERAMHITQGPPFLWRFDLIGLRKAISSKIYPLSLKGAHLVVAIYNPRNFGEGHICIESKANNEKIPFDIKLETDQSIETPLTSSKSMEIFNTNEKSWDVFLLPLNDVIIQHPGLFNLFLLKGKQEFPLGTLLFGLERVEPLTPEKIAAIKSNPKALKAVRFVIGCKECNESVKCYASLDRKKEETGYIWYEDLPDEFKCSCGKNTWDLTILRKNLHGLLVSHVDFEGNVSLTRLYEKNALDITLNDFRELIDTDPLEEAVQKFIETNPILLHTLSPQRTFWKPPILSKFVADIAVLNQKKELILIEIEKPGKKILKQDGGLTADAQRPFTQLNEWLCLIDDHRAAFLSGLNLTTADVSKIRGMVVIGRNEGYDSEHIRKLHWTDFGKCEFNTYDDMVNSLATLIRGLKGL